MGNYYSKLAERLAREGHDGQFRFDGVTPYITHVEAVVALVRLWYPDDDELEAGAWLHDYIEDVLKAKTREELETAKQFLLSWGFSVRVVGLAADMTRLPEVPYEVYIVELNGKEAKKIKVPDNLVNLGDDPTKKQVKKYSNSLRVLLAP